MSQSKEHFYASFGGRGSWRDASRSRPCPVCSHDSWCQIAKDGQTVLCKRTPSETKRVNRDGVDYFVHHSGPVPPSFAPASGVVDATCASPERRDEVYSCQLRLLNLQDAHRKALRNRGLTGQNIEQGLYRSFPLEGRTKLARRVIDCVGEPEGVPGFYRKNHTWTLAGSPGLLVPVRNLQGHIVALKVRPDDTATSGKYLYVSSAKYGGPSAESAVHVPVFAKRTFGQDVRITEGELKADAATAISSVPTLSVPGVGNWKKVLTVLNELHLIRVLIAFDTDARRNVHVANAQLELVRALKEFGFRVELERWSESYKGIDDFLVAQRPVAHQEGGL